MKPKKLLPAKMLSGEITLPGDKSISHRAIMLGAIARGKTSVRGLLDCDDCRYTARAFKDMGLRVARKGGITVIEGAGLRGLKRPRAPINVGNSGTSMRLLAGILAGQGFGAVLTGNEGLLRRPMKRIVDPLAMMGVNIAAGPDGLPPIKINGAAMKAISYKMPVSSAQVKSAILFAGLYASGTTTVNEKVKSRDHTERMMKYFGADVRTNGLAVSVSGGRELAGREIEIPGDISSASFFIAGAVLLAGSKINIRKVSINPTRVGILNILSAMGARVKIVNKVDAFEPYADIEVESGPINGVEIGQRDIPGIIDELPVIFVLASLAKGRTVIKGAEELRVKETDRIDSMMYNLGRMGANISVDRGTIVIDGVERLRGAELKSYGDHRTVMSMAIAALTASGASSIDDVECVSKSLPEFFELLSKLRR
ncbi:MAG: 3-phosphoshikimate 1-carboxyvinyltransferase [Candidatus Omnitrophica bacterium]|nr:3-phosphoshikimate 1-carboxyvinyltransferase [Candidatus Omnitrophota bacterium]